MEEKHMRRNYEFLGGNLLSDEGKCNIDIEI